MIASVPWGGLAAIIVCGALAIFLLFLTFQLTRIMESIKMTIDGIRQEVVPLLGEVKTTVSEVNKELERVDGMLESVGRITKSVEPYTTVTIEDPKLRYRNPSDFVPNPELSGFDYQI